MAIDPAPRLSQVTVVMGASDDTSNRLQLSIQDRLEELPRLHDAVETFAARGSLPSTVVEAIDLVLEEAVTNVIQYAFDGPGPHTIDVEVASFPDEVIVCIEDAGRPFDPLAATELETGRPADALPAKHLGLRLLRQVAQALSYHRENGKNLLEIRLGMPAE